MSWPIFLVDALSTALGRTIKALPEGLEQAQQAEINEENLRQARALFPLKQQRLQQEIRHAEAKEGREAALFDPALRQEGVKASLAEQTLGPLVQQETLKPQLMQWEIAKAERNIAVLNQQLKEAEALAPHRVDYLKSQIEENRARRDNLVAMTRELVERHAKQLQAANALYSVLKPKVESGKSAQQLLQDPELIATMAQYSPWLKDNPLAELMARFAVGEDTAKLLLNMFRVQDQASQLAKDLIKQYIPDPPPGQVAPPEDIQAASWLRQYATSVINRSLGVTVPAPPMPPGMRAKLREVFRHMAQTPASPLRRLLPSWMGGAETTTDEAQMERLLSLAEPLIRQGLSFEEALLLAAQTPPAPADFGVEQLPDGTFRIYEQPRK